MKNETDIQTHVIFVAAFVKKGDTFLLSKRSKDDPQAGGLWSIPGGKVELEVGQRVIEATLKKEIKEEVDIDISDSLQYLGSDGFIRVSGHHVVGLTFLAHWKSGKAKALEDQEEVGWYTLPQLQTMPDIPNYLTARIKQLTEYLNMHKHS